MTNHPDPSKPFFCFTFDRWQKTACGCKGCARRRVNKLAARGVCPGEWKWRGYARASHSMFHPAMHECAREQGHAGRCRCFCGHQTTTGLPARVRAGSYRGSRA